MMNIRPIKCEKCGKKLSLFEGNICLECEEKAIQALEQESCEDAISRQAVNEIINDIRDCISVEGYWAIIGRMKKLPPITPQPKVGHWIDHQEDRWIYAKCSECGSVHDTQTNYCPNCGARMESEE